MSTIIGISAYYHDSAVALIKDGEIIFAVQEERFSRIKHDSNFPVKSLNYLIEHYNVDLNAVDAVVFYDKPLLKFERLLETYIKFSPRGLRSFLTAIPVVLREKLFLKNLMTKEIQKISKYFNTKKIFFSEHHLSHAASAFFPSPYENAIILTMDGVGEWATASIAIGKSNSIKIMKEMHFPHSLGLLYSAFTYYLGFKVNSGEYKVMGLAPYGDPIYKQIILNKLIDLKNDGSFRLNMKYFNYTTGLTMTNHNFEALFEQPRRNEESEIKKFHMDIAASIQYVIEKIVLRITRNISEDYEIQNLCLAGGVALNCVANGKVLEDGKFKNIWVQPAAGDAGGAIGSALAFHYIRNKNKRTSKLFDQMKGSYLGPSFSQDMIEEKLKKINAVYTVKKEDEIINYCADSLSKGKIIGWFQGRMEFGPRALGNRSILANPMMEDMQKKLNLKIKFRESFRPFAPSVLREDVEDWFDLKVDSPYMQLVSTVANGKRKENVSKKKSYGFEQLNEIRSSVPAITHVNYTARIQTVHKETNYVFHKLITKFKELTGCPILINTSFNIRGEPIVNTTHDAFKCFMRTEMDMLIIGNCLILKGDQSHNIENYEYDYELD